MSQVIRLQDLVQLITPIDDIILNGSPIITPWDPTNDLVHIDLVEHNTEEYTGAYGTTTARSTIYYCTTLIRG